MILLSKILFYLSSFSILPPIRSEQETIIKNAENKYQGADRFIKNSLCQYECQRYYFRKPVWYIFAIFSTLVFAPLFLFLLLRGLKQKSSKKMIENVSLYKKIPLDIATQFQPIFIKKPFGYLKIRDLKYIYRILFKSGFKPYFLLRSVWKLAVYSEIIDTYKPKKIWVIQEMVFESTILTKYLENFAIEHINLQHGDNFFSIQVAFCSFHKFYVWDDYYIGLFNSLKANIGSYHKYFPLDRKTSLFKERNIIKYYSQELSNLAEFNKILDNLDKFSQIHNCKVVVRLHPLHQKNVELQILKNRNIEVEPNTIDIIDSISESKYVCSEFSSVLFQASLLGKTIVIDNSFLERFKIIKELDVIFITKLPHMYLVTA